MLLHYSCEHSVDACTYSLIACEPTVTDRAAYNNYAWNQTNHSQAIIVENWGGGYNGGVPSPASGWHAHWTFNGQGGMPCIEFINYNHTIGQSKRWMGSSRSLGQSFSAMGLTYGDTLTLAFDMWSDDHEKSGVGPSLYGRHQSGSNNHMNTIRRYKNTKTGVWERIEVVFTIDSDVDLTATFNLYMYGQYADDGCVVRCQNMTIYPNYNHAPYNKIGRSWARSQQILRDTSGNENHTLLSHLLTPMWRNHEGRRCYLFGKDSEIVTDITFTQSDVRSYACWFNSADYGIERPLIEFNDGSSVSYDNLTVIDNNTLRIVFTVDGTPLTFDTTVLNLCDGTWKQLGATIGGGEVRVFCNGRLVNISSYTDGALETTGTLWIGKGTNGSKLNEGYISDIRVYEETLTQEQITELSVTAAKIHRDASITSRRFSEVSTGGRLPSDNNLLNYEDWEVGSADSEGDDTGIGRRYTRYFGRNGEAGENSRILDVNPRGELDCIWKASAVTPGSGDGGFNTGLFRIQHALPYRFSVWAKKPIAGRDTDVGNFYLGCRGHNSSDTNVGVVTNLTGSVTTNPYFFANEDETYGMEDGEWRLFVGYVYPSGYTTVKDAWRSKIYNPNGSGVQTYGPSTIFAWQSSCVYGMLRTYQFYSSAQTPPEEMWFYRPRVDVLDGTEPSIGELLACREHLPQTRYTDPSITNKASVSKEGVTAKRIDTLGVSDGLVFYTPYARKQSAMEFAGGAHGELKSFGTGIGLPTLTPEGYVFSHDTASNGNYILHDGARIQYSEYTLFVRLRYENDDNVNPPSGSRHIITSGDNDYNPQVNGTNQLTFYVTGGSVQTPVDTVKPNEWHDVAFIHRSSYSGSSGSSEMFIYVDGVLAASTTISAAIFNRRHLNPIAVGMDWDGTAASDSFMGTIAEIRGYNRVLSVDELNKISENIDGITNVKMRSDGVIETTGIKST